MQTLCLTTEESPLINSVFMATERTIPAGPLAQWLTQNGRGSKAELAKKLKLSSGQAVITNWLKRGTVPLSRFEEVCAAIGMSEDRYRSLAGLKIKGSAQADLDSAELLSHFEALPPGLRAYVTRKARRLREIYDGHPILREVFTPPKDPARNKEWEREIEALMLKLQRDDDAE